MITNFFLTMLYVAVQIATYPITLLDDAAMPAEFLAAVSSANNYLANLNHIFPVNTLLSIFLIVLAIEGIIFIYKIIRWAYQKIPGIN